jgi:hypothetical protein
VASKSPSCTHASAAALTAADSSAGVTRQS